ncbi:MAG: T9SS type A sorting domain-containing protein [Bacteroidota bacterium]
MKTVATILSVLAISISTTFAQRQATSTITDFVSANGTYSFDLYARSTGVQTIRVGTSSFYFNYNSAALSSPVLTNINPKFTGQNGIGDYDSMEVDIISGQIAVTVLFTGNNTGLAQLLSTSAPDGERICTINLTIIDGSQSALLSWNTVNSALTHSTGGVVSQIFVGSDEGPLPIQLASFTAIALEQGRVRLDWRTITETNNYGFDVQKASDQPENFSTIPNSFIPGHGTTVEPHDYTFTDNGSGQGTWYYRLKQTDLDGTIHFSDPVQVDVLSSVEDRPLPTEFSIDQNYPNPFNPTTSIEFALPKEAHVNIEVFNIIGEKVATLVNEVRQVGYYKEKFDASAFSSGLYFYRMTTNNVSFLKKMVLVK